MGLRCSSTAARPSPPRSCTCPDRISSIGSSFPATAMPAWWPTSSGSTVTGAWAARATSPSCPSTRASSTPPAARFAKNPDYFDPENIVRLAIEGGCNAVASTLGVLGIVARKYAHKIPFLVKINHNELLTYPEQVRPDPVRLRQAGLRHGRRGGRAPRSISARSSPTARSSKWPQAFAARPRAGHGHRALVLPPQRRLQDHDKPTTTSPPISPARPITWA